MLGYSKIKQLVKLGAIENAEIDNIGPASLDVRLSHEIFVEDGIANRVIDLSAKQSIKMQKQSINYFLLHPGMFILASTIEKFNLPSNIGAVFKLRSSIARNGIEQLNACFCDPGWTDSHLTLELKNITNHHTFILKEGLRIGQMVFFEINGEIPEEKLYSKIGRYNHQSGTVPSKGV